MVSLTISAEAISSQVDGFPVSLRSLINMKMVRQTTKDHPLCSLFNPKWFGIVFFQNSPCLSNISTCSRFMCEATSHLSCYLPIIFCFVGLSLGYQLEGIDMSDDR